MSLGIFRAFGRRRSAKVQRDPDSFESILALAETAVRQGNLQLGIEYYSRLTELEPSHALAYYKRGNLLRDCGELEAALASYDQAIVLDPAYAHAFCNRGVVLERLSRLDAALDSLERAIALDRGDFIAHYNRGTVLRLLNRQRDALASYDQAIAINPNHVESLCNRGIILADLEQWDSALESYNQAIAINPHFSQAFCNRGALFQKRRLFDASLESYDKAIEINADDADAQCGRGLALASRRKWREGLMSLERAIALNPEIPEAYCGRGRIFAELGRHDAALADLDHAIALNADYGDAYQIRGNLRIEMRQYSAAVADYDQAVEKKADCRFLPGLRLHSKMMICDWTDLEADTERLAAGIQAGNAVSPPFPVLSMLDSAPLQMKSAQVWLREEVNAAAAPSPLWRGEHYRHDKIRVAYVSADFRQHAVSTLLARVFETHDRERFEIIAISLRPAEESRLAERVGAAFDAFVDVSQLSDRDAAALMRDRQVDIAVDLMGYTQGSRSAILAYRSAPVQVNYLGYPGTTAAPYMDYIIADEFAIPSERRGHYTEKIVWLPDSFQANDDQRAIAPSAPPRRQFGLPDSGLVFCCFNNHYKINPACFDVWMRLLQSVPDSVLWLLGDEPSVQSNLRREATNRGVDPGRLVFAARIPYDDHLARLSRADLFLDTLPFNAGATASDALWAGVPVVTCAGEALAARMAGSLLAAVGLPELITDNLAQYEALTLKLATTPRLLADTRARLAANRLKSPLFKSEQFCRHLESAYVSMHQRAEAGLPPEDIRVEANQ
jgi:protein O-GlcNAc transferase